MKKSIKYIIIELLFVGIIISLDLLTKHFIYQKAYEQGKIVLIKGVLSFLSTQNTGASFGIFKDATTILTIISAVSSVGMIFFLIISINHRNLFLRFGLILIIGGAIGNLVDRAVLGYVRDFVYFELINFAIFNLADSALTVGSILLIVYLLFFYNNKKHKKIIENNEEPKEEME